MRRLFLLAVLSGCSGPIHPGHNNLTSWTYKGTGALTISDLNGNPVLSGQITNVTASLTDGGFIADEHYCPSTWLDNKLSPINGRVAGGYELSSNYGQLLDNKFGFVIKGTALFSGGDGYYLQNTNTLYVFTETFTAD